MCSNKQKAVRWTTFLMVGARGLLGYNLRTSSKQASASELDYRTTDLQSSPIGKSWVGEPNLQPRHEKSRANAQLISWSG